MPSAQASGSARSVAKGVGCMPLGVRRNSSSPSSLRNRASALLTAGWVRPMLPATLETRFSTRNWLKTTSRFRSISRKSTRRPILQQQVNSVPTRQILPDGHGAFDFVWTHFGFADDSAEMTQRRLRQANLFGPAGFVSADDGEVIEFSQRGFEQKPDHRTLVELGGREVFATDNLCTHGQARLCEGFLLGHEIECPFHQGRFDIRSGQATCEPATEAVRCYPVKINAGRVCLAIG